MLVLHCRGIVGDLPHTDNLIQSLMDLLLASSIKQTQLIHFHCFTGSYQVAQTWLKNFPNTYFGFTRIGSHSNALPRLPLNRILLETDAPYFKFNNRDSTPHDIGQVAHQIAPVCNVDWEYLLEVTTNNARNLYHFRIAPQ